MSYTQFRNKWIGKRIDYDRIYGYQCVDLIKQYAHEVYGLKAGAWGNAIDYWYSTHKDLYKKFTRVSTKSARKGDIVIFKGINGNPYGHIGIADRNAGRWTVATLEQNGSSGNGSGRGRDAIRVRKITKSRIVGVLRPRTAKPVLKMPRIGSRIQLQPKDIRTTWRAGTRKRAGYIQVKDNSYIYVVRGYDPVYGGRIIINSRSGGGNGVALALYYTNGKRIPKWKAL